MTLFYYIAASRKLPTGSFGQKKTFMTLNPQGDNLIEIYETEEDAAGLYITGPILNQDSTHLFRHPLVYQVNPEGGSFQINDEIKQFHPTSYQTSKKCLTELFDYLRSNVEIGEELELYSCWANGCE